MSMVLGRTDDVDVSLPMSVATTAEPCLLVGCFFSLSVVSCECSIHVVTVTVWYNFEIVSVNKLLDAWKFSSRSAGTLKMKK